MMEAAAKHVKELYSNLVKGDRVALGRAITMVESRNADHRADANQLLDLCLSKPQTTFRFAVSGPPGVGKSTFIESLGQHITGLGQKLAVLAIDPTSRLTGGSILGDKTRMSKLSQNPDVFIRPSAAGDALGGVTEATREAITLCEAAGYENICIETVGVGQSEVTVRDMCDFMLLLVSPGGGDDLQGIKRGIVELADMIAVNKSDGDQKQLARETRQDYTQATHLFPEKTHGQQVAVVNCSAIEHSGIDAIWRLMSDFNLTMRANKYIDKLRKEQDSAWLRSRVNTLLEQILMANPQVRTYYQEQLDQVRSGAISVSSASAGIEAEVRKMFHL